MLGAVTFGHRAFQPVIQAIIELAETCAQRPLGAATRPGRFRRRSRPGCARRSAPCSKPPIANRASRTAATGSMPPRRRSPNCSPMRGSAAWRSSCSRISKRRSCAAPSCAAAAGSTAATPGRCGRSPPRSAFCRAPTARRCSPAAKPRRWWWPRSAPARTSRSSMRSKASTGKTSCCTTISRPIPPARRAAWARPGGARSATASSPGARSGRCCRPRKASPTRSASSPRSPSRTAPRRWPRCAAPRCR